MEKKEIQKLERSSTMLILNNGKVLDFEGLPEETVVELRKKHAEGLIELERTMIEYGIQSKDIQQRLSDITDSVAKASADQTSATITGSYDDKLGRTEVIAGNTETAARGKLTRSQQGQKDNLLLYIGIGFVALIIISLILSR